jgi:integrase
MPRRVRSHKLENRTNRLKLPFSKKPLFVAVSPGINLGYRRCVGAGRWIVRGADGHGGSWQKAFACADDHQEANGETILSFWEAQDKARRLANGQDSEIGKPQTVGTAIAEYEKDLRARDGNVGNILRLRFHVTPQLLAKPLPLLTMRELKSWRGGLLDKMKPGSANRTGGVLRSVLLYAAQHDEQLAGHAAAWRLALKAIPHAQVARNTILTDSEVRAVIAAAYIESIEFGLWIETASATGARASQLARLTVGDLQDDRPDPRLMVPRSRKGRAGSRKQNQRVPVPIGFGLAKRLRQAAGNRDAAAALLTRADGQPWRTNPSDIRRPFQRAAAAAGVPHATAYALRHSCAARAIIAGTPLRLVANALDTSTMMLERNYSALIGDHSDSLMRRSLLADEPAGDNVLPLPTGRRT